MLTSSTARADAQKIYSWTDENGVVHFADAPPTNREFSVEDLPQGAPPPATDRTPATGGEAASEGRPEDETAEGTAPANVVIEEQSSQSGGGPIQSYSGTVKNVGGKEARNVRIAIKVTETVQGAECLEEQIEVKPSTLPPGESGTFSAEFENPCFHGPTDSKLRPEWDEK